MVAQHAAAARSMRFCVLKYVDRVSSEASLPVFVLKLCSLSVLSSQQLLPHCCKPPLRLKLRGLYVSINILHIWKCQRNNNNDNTDDIFPALELGTCRASLVFPE